MREGLCRLQISEKEQWEYSGISEYKFLSLKYKLWKGVKVFPHELHGNKMVIILIIQAIFIVLISKLLFFNNLSNWILSWFLAILVGILLEGLIFFIPVIISCLSIFLLISYYLLR